MKKAFSLLAGSSIVLLATAAVIMNSPARATQSTITETEGYACMGDDKSKKQTETEAFANAKRNAAEYASTYITSITTVKDMQIDQDLINAYAQATVRVMQELGREWYKDQSKGDCFRIRLKAEVIPDEKKLKQSETKDSMEDPASPLKVKVWADKKEYKLSDKVKIYIKGNKPFYARIIYRDSTNNIIQILPNPFRPDNYFQGGIVYEIPSGNDTFNLEVTPPFGKEGVTVYASSSPLGELDLKDAGNTYVVITKEKDIGIKTRGIKIKESSQVKSGAAEFFEENLDIMTVK